MQPVKQWIVLFAVVIQLLVDMFEKGLTMAADAVAMVVGGSLQ